jgi:hypothetical protein
MRWNTVRSLRKPGSGIGGWWDDIQSPLSLRTALDMICFLSTLLVPRLIHLTTAPHLINTCICTYTFTCTGFEDHYGSDQFHNTHHRFFECNYGGTDLAFVSLFSPFFQHLS